jgi:hypothetical protein
MTVSLTNITGSAQTGLTSPTYTVAADQAPDVNAKQWFVSALGGTQTGVDIHSVAKPFTLTFFRPKNPQVLGTVNPVTGALSKVPMNVYKLVTRKGVLPLASQPSRNLIIRTEIEVPAGSDTADPEDIRAALSAHIGALSQQSSGLGDTLIQGTL